MMVYVIVMYLVGSTLVEGQRPRPEPAAGQLLVRVCAAGVTPSELLWYPTAHTVTGEQRVDAIPGHEFSGIVEATGSEVIGFKAGDLVFGMNDWFADGAMAEYCLALPSAIALKPASLSHVEAASVPIGALTAQQGLFDHAALKPGERVLIHGGAGSVGLFAVQLAAQHGAHVITTVSARNREFVLGLGAHEAIDYHQAPFEEQVGKVDVVFDTVGGETLARSWNVLKPGGRMVTVAGTSESADERVRKAFFIVERNGKQLAEIAERVKTVVDSVYPLAQASEVFVERVPRQGRGKVVIEINE